MLNLRHAKPITEQPLTFRFEERNRERAPTPRGEPARERSPTGATERDVAETAPTRATEGEPNRLSQREILRELSRERERERVRNRRKSVSTLDACQRRGGPSTPYGRGESMLFFFFLLIFLKFCLKRRH